VEVGSGPDAPAETSGERHPYYTVGGYTGVAAHAVRQNREPFPMVTTNRLIPVEAFGRDPPELVHLTGSFLLLTRVTIGSPDDLPAHVELCFDAVQVRGVGLKTGVRYQARGAYRFREDPKELPVSLDLVSTFELLRHGPDDPTPRRLLLVVPFRVMVQSDGKVTAHVEAPTLLPCPGG
jgi:hypothetical protein